MCGIAGIVRRQSIDSAEIQRLSEYVHHRGPDGVRCWVNADSTVALGHSRLAIIDLTTAADQPMASSDGRYQIVYNGEIFNYKELKAELSAIGYSFQTTSDTEVVLAACLTWGEAALDRFNGMWAFALYDTVQCTMFLARDRFGVKPLYYHHSRDEIVFASEIKAIGKFVGSKASANQRFLERLIRYDLTAYSESETFLNGIVPVLPGWLCRIDRDLKVTPQRWYHLHRVPVPTSISDQATQLRELLSNACQIRLRSDVPVATCLSGGVDSGAIVSLLADSVRESGSEAGSFTHKSFTATFPGWSLDESEGARSLSKQKGMDLDLHTVDCPSPEQLEDAMHACDGPMPALSFYPIWKLYQHIKTSGISVTLDGQGADEMLGGYYLGYPAMKGALQTGRPFWCIDLFKTYRSLGDEANQRAWSDLGAVCREYRTTVSQRLKDPVKRILATIGVYSPGPLRGTQADSPPEVVFSTDPDAANSLAKALWSQFFVNPLPFLLHKYDRCSMASGVECRMPFMDYRVVEYIFSLPLSSRIGGGYTKRVLRQALKGILPDNIRTNRKKIGFNAPFSDWIQGSLRGWTQDIMASRSFSESSYFDGKALRRTFESPNECLDGKLAEWVLWPCLHNAWWHLNQ
jgi:asparagine synthase (glutamine-hydrolysing)